MKYIFLAMTLLVGWFFVGCSSAPELDSPEKEYPVSAEAEAKYQAAENNLSKKDYGSALGLLEEALPLTKNRGQRDKISFLTGECLFLLEYYNPSYKWFRQFLIDFPRTERLNDVINRELEIGFKFINGAKRSLWGEYYDEALSEYENFIKVYPKSKLVPEAEYHMAQCYVLMYQGYGYEVTPLAEAYKITSKFLEKYPDSATNNEASKLHERITNFLAQRDYEVAMFYIRTDKAKSARIYLDSVIKNYPETQWAKNASVALAGLQDK